MHLCQTNFIGSKGAKINPQTVQNNDLIWSVFSGVEFIGPFDGANIYNTDFTGSRGARINLQTICCYDLFTCVLTDAEVIGDLDMKNIGTIKSRNINNETEIIDTDHKLMRKKNK